MSIDKLMQTNVDNHKQEDRELFNPIKEDAFCSIDIPMGNNQYSNKKQLLCQPASMLLKKSLIEFPKIKQNIISCHIKKADDNKTHSVCSNVHNFKTMGRNSAVGIYAKSLEKTKLKSRNNCQFDTSYNNNSKNDNSLDNSSTAKEKCYICIEKDKVS